MRRGWPLRLDVAAAVLIAAAGGVGSAAARADSSPTAPAEAASTAAPVTAVPTVVMPPGSPIAADVVVATLDRVVPAFSTVLGASIIGPWEVHVHADVDALLRANPLAAEEGGVIGGARRSRHQAHVVMPPDPSDRHAWSAGIRQEVARLLILGREGGDLPDVWVDGIADYMAGPALDRASGVARLRQAWTDGSIPSWLEVSSSEGPYLDPPVVRPLALSAVHFLVRQYGLDSLLAVVDVAASGSPWTDALEKVLGAPLGTLEREWQGGLQAYLDGGWREHDLYEPDLGRLRQFLADGELERAERVLRPASVLVPLDDPDRAVEVADLLDAAQASRSALQALDDGLRALASGDYVRAAMLADTAMTTTGLDASGRDAARELATRARLGAAATNRARAADGLPSWRALEARALAASAAADFARLGGDTAAVEAARTVAEANRQLRPAGAALVAAGVLVLLHNAAARRRRGRSAA